MLFGAQAGGPTKGLYLPPAVLPLDMPWSGPVQPGSGLSWRAVWVITGPAATSGRVLAVVRRSGSARTAQIDNGCFVRYHAMLRTVIKQGPPIGGARPFPRV